MVDEKLEIFLRQLTIQNFATFKNQTLSFSNGLNIIAGETGSGKSLVLDALQLVFGARSDKKLIRKGCDHTSIEAIFEIREASLKSYFQTLGYPLDGEELVIKRIIYSSGKTQSLLNYSKCPLQLLNEISSRFVDIVGQFENQKLLNDKYLLKLIDLYSSNRKLQNQYKESFDSYKSLSLKKDDLEESLHDLPTKIEYLAFQKEKLEQLSPKSGEETQLIEDKQLLQKNQGLKNELFQIQKDLFESERSLIRGLDLCLNILEKYPKRFTSLSEQDLYSTRSALEDFSYEVSKFLDADDDSGELELINERLDLYQKLKLKYKCSNGDDLVLIYNQTREKLDTLLDLNKNLEQIEADLKKAHQKASLLATELSQERQRSANKLSRELSQLINKLNMTGSEIRFHFLEKDLTKHGIDKIDFLIQTNVGEGFFPVKKIASGGELSRILLALRKSISSKDTISVFLFDEIDTGIGGKTAQIIGSYLKDISSSSQVIAVTHLPQVINFADCINVVSKTVEKEKNQKRTFSQATMLGQKEKKKMIEDLYSIH